MTKESRIAKAKEYVNDTFVVDAVDFFDKAEVISGIQP